MKRAYARHRQADFGTALRSGPEAPSVLARYGAKCLAAARLAALLRAVVPVADAER